MPLQESELFPFGCAPDQTSGKNLSRALSKPQRAPGSPQPHHQHPAACSRDPAGTQEGRPAGKAAAGGVSEPSGASQGSELRHLLGGEAGLARLQPEAPASALLRLCKHGFTGVLQEGQGVCEPDGLQSLP